jgi:hypothetical protein
VAFPHTGPHVHGLDIQMFYVLKGGLPSLIRNRGSSCSAPTTAVCNPRVLCTTRSIVRRISN